jgi:hypothetical protein
MKTMKEQFSEHAQEELIVYHERNSSFVEYCNIFSSIIPGSIYMLDIPRKQFCNVKLDDFFLCGYQPEDIIKERFGFYSKIVYREDLSLWTDMRKVVLRYLKDFDLGKRDEIDYFSCTFRLQRKYYLLPQMVYHCMKPVWEDGVLRYLICYVVSSIIQKAGNLCMHNKDGLAYEEYSFTTKRWKRKMKERLTEHDKVLLMLSIQGEKTKNIANYLHKGENTIIIGRNRYTPN